jgi:integrase/recombinase XerD
MESVSEQERDLGSIRLPRWGRVLAVDGIVPWVVIDPAAELVAPIEEFLRDFVAQGSRPASVRSYAYDLLRWWRWLQVTRSTGTR